MSNKALNACAQAYGIWLVAARIAQEADLGPDTNISGYMSYAIVGLLGGSKKEDKSLLDDPYYLPIQENWLSPLHQRHLETSRELLVDQSIGTSNNHKQEYIGPFHEYKETKEIACRLCGYFMKQGHRCSITLTCMYSLCGDAFTHTKITCRHIGAWCHLCQCRGHAAKWHFDTTYPWAYMHALFIHYKGLNVETGYVL